MTGGRPARVLIVTDTLASGGAERVAVDIANSLDRRRYEAHVCSTRHDGPLRHELRADVPVTILDRQSTWEIRGLAQFVRYVRSRKIDLIHSHGRGTMKFVSLLRVGRLITSKHVFHDHYGPLHVDRRASPDVRLALRSGVDHYLGVDRRLCTWATQVVGLDADRVHLVRSGVDLARFNGIVPTDLRRTFDLDGCEVVLVMIAHFRHQKDQPTALRALAALPEAIRNRLGIVIVGRTPTDTDYFDRCMAMADALGVRAHIRVAGLRDDAPSLLAGADGALVVSRNETGPLVVLEYMASGLPFVATDTGEIAAAVRDQQVGFTPAPRDHREVAAALSKLVLLGPEGRRQMGQRGRSLAIEQFDQRSVTRQIELIYQEVLTRDPDCRGTMGNTLSAGE